MPEDDERITLGEVPSIADVRYLDEMRRPQEETPANDESWTPRNLAEMEDRPPVTPTLGDLGFVYPGKRHVFSGPQESAKTLAAYVVGLHVVREGQRVVLIDFEMGPWDAKTRLRELGCTDDELGAFSYVEPETPSTPERVRALVDLEPGLVLVDAAAGAFSLEGLDDNARKDVERWANAWVTPFWRAGVATIVLDHVTKNAETRGNYAIGSERKVGGADVHLGFTVVRPVSRGDHGLYKVTTHKDRGGCLKRGHLCDFRLLSDPETNAISWEFVVPQTVDEEHPFRPTFLMERVSRYLERQMDEVTMKQLEQDVEGKRDGLRAAVAVLRDEGYLQESEGPRKARLLTSVRPYREADDDTERPRPTTSPHLAPEPADATSPLAPSAYRRGEDEGDVLTSPLTSPQASLDEDDGIPF